MAGGHGPHILFDPAIEKWFNMQENTSANFRFNRRTVTHCVALVVVFPTFLYVGANLKKWQLKFAEIRGAPRVDKQ
ncbi:hypothetical protein BC830DRAFT_195777 [Chytriomyces sp. MP71]|nr:hypothetical protein BC830DRAFT_195777 [Chytriomyces sp. MP71]